MIEAALWGLGEKTPFRHSVAAHTFDSIWIEESIVIDRPHEEVFAFFDDRRNDSRWMGSVHDSNWVDPEESTGVGRRGRMVMEVIGRREFDDVVVEYKAGREVAHRSVSDDMAIYSACHAEPVPEGTKATVIIAPESMPWGIFAKLVAPLVAWSIRRNVRSDLLLLKRLLEVGAGAEPAAGL